MIYLKEVDAIDVLRKNKKAFCIKNDIDYADIKEAWFDFKVRGKAE